MAEITAALVKELREKTGAGMMDCKKALSETGGDLEGAVDWLRKKGLSAAAKKAGRVAAEGLVGVAAEGKTGAVVEVNSETDFVARNEQFQGFVRAVTSLALHGDDVEALKGKDVPGAGRNVADQLTHLVATIGENMTLRRAKRLAVQNGVVLSYVHNQVAPGLGKIGVLVALESSADPGRLAAAGKPLALHVAAANPLFLDRASVPASALERERQIQIDRARQEGTPEDIAVKKVEGRLQKEYFKENVLLEQVSVMDNKTPIQKVVEQIGKEAGAPVKIAAYVRFALGEGIEKKEGDFAAEVAAQLKPKD